MTHGPMIQSSGDQPPTAYEPTVTGMMTSLIRPEKHRLL